MAQFSHHEPCPACGSKDNLGVWTDGHKYCFGCKYVEYVPKDIKKIFEPSLEKDPKAFPYDATYEIPAEPMKWLLSHYITHTTQKLFNIQWSSLKQMLCWKIGDMGWQGRCFDPKAKTKYYGQGKIHSKPLILDNNLSSTLVIVEDYISAIRVSDYLPCMPLFGCTINLETLQGVLERFSSFLIWLDGDKLDNARKIASKLSMMGLEVKVIYTSKDPKEHSPDQLKEILNEQV